MKKITATNRPLGATLTKNGVNIAVLSESAHSISVCFYEKTGKKLLGCHPLPHKSDGVFYGFFEGDFTDKLYALRAYGDNGGDFSNRFNSKKLLIDPYALELNEEIKLHQSMFDNELDSGEFVPKAKIIAPKRAKFSKELAGLGECEIIYELNVRGFTAQKLDIPQELRGTFAGLGHPNSVKYLKDLGISAVELLPCAAWIDEKHLFELGLRNYWGYNPIGFMAPDPRLAPNGWAEVSDCVNNLAKAGIKTIIDVVFNHSGEGDKYGPIVSLRGLDNQTYYRLYENDKSEYINDAGTGNILDAQSPAVIALVLDSLRAWHRYGGVHGFRFDLASVLGRTQHGFDSKSALLSAINEDAELSKLLLIAEPWDCGPGGYQLGAFGDNWPEWNDKYRDCMRKFWLENSVTLGEFATRFCGSQDIFHGRSPQKSVNYICAHDGFTLRDLVSYENKNNYANGEENRDGSDNNYSTNHGFEGPTDDLQINQTRAKSQRALLTSLLLSRGIPMISMGSEQAKTQNGNNNAYAQDNEISYLDWGNIDEDLLLFTQKLIKLRRGHRAIFDPNFLTGCSNEYQTYPDIEWRTPQGKIVTNEDWEQCGNCGLGIILTNDRTYKDRIAIFINQSYSALEFKLPNSRDKQIWMRVLDTSHVNGGEEKLIKTDSFEVNSRSIVVMSEKASKSASLNPAKEELITKLSEALGIESQWKDVNGKTTIVPLTTKIKLIESMGYSCATDCQALESLKDFSDKYFRRPLPFAMCATENEQFEIRLYNNSEPSLSLNIEFEDKRREIINAAACTRQETKDPDGQNSIYYQLEFNGLPLGRYRIWRDDYPDVICQLSVAPRFGYLPQILETKSLAGLSSQIYALKRTGDQGIGDFTSLGNVLGHCSKRELDILGINPLHALFPANKDLASPYYPSDRIALEPHYIDLGSIIKDDDFSQFEHRESVDYEEMWRFKSAALEKHYQDNRDLIEADRGFIEFKKEIEPPIRQFALFQAICEKFPGQTWRQWPSELANRQSEALDEFAKNNADRVNYHIYLQYLCDLQLKQAAQIGAQMKIGICRDLAIGTSPDGAESWAIQSKMAKNVSIGAPPDLLGPRGQVWGLPPLVPHIMIESGFKSAIGLYRANMKHAGALRIDHAMGIMRQFWVPEGVSACDGAYVRFPFANILAELKLESHRAKCVIIGEDLGTVPEGFSETMNAANALSYKVLQFEKNGDAFKAPEEYPKACFACISTHDLAPIKGWWQGVDIEERKLLGLYTADEAIKCEADRLVEKNELLNALYKKGLISELGSIDSELTIEIVAAIHAYIAQSPAYLAIAQIEDLAGEIIPINLPGTDRERPNWRNCVKRPIDEIFSTDDENAWANAIITALRAKNSSIQ